MGFPKKKSVGWLVHRRFEKDVWLGAYHQLKAIIDLAGGRKGKTCPIKRLKRL